MLIKSCFINIIKKFFLFFCIGLIFLSFLCSTIVYATPNKQVEQLILFGGTGLDQMHTAVEAQYLHDGDAMQHQWTTSIGSVTDMISSDSLQAAKQAVAVWIGEDYLTTRIPGYEEWFDNDWLGRDGSDLPSNAAEYSGTALGRAINGYDYYVLEARTSASGSEDSIPSDAVHLKYPDEPAAQAHAPTPNYSDTLSTGSSVPEGAIDVSQEYRTEYEEDPITGELVGHQVFDHYSYRERVSWTYYVEVKRHKKGYGEYWKEKGAMVYVVSLAPYSKSTDEKERNEQNGNTKSFNRTLEGLVPNMNYLDIFDITLEHNPYYQNGSDHGSYYDDQTLCWIFHLIWNSILEDNPNEEPPEPVDQTFYSISASLTSYMNNVLSMNADEQHSTHVLSEAGSGVANAGAFVGYGDEDYDFQSYITGNLSKTSSVIDYSSLIGHEGGTNNMYLYARYGYLLSDMGFDSVGAASASGTSRWIPGGLMYVAYFVSTGIVVLFSAIFSVLKFLNPFQFLVNASSISDSMKGAFIESSGVNNSFLADVLDFLGYIYDGFQNIGIYAIIPISLCFLMASILLSRRVFETSAKWTKIKSFLIRFVFMVLGIPFLGILYTSALSSIDGMTSSADCASSQMVASTFVDFEKWAKKLRLDPIDGGVFESDPSGMSGEASDKTYKHLRSTAVALNQKVGAIDHVDMSGFFGTNNVNNPSDWILNGFELMDTSDALAVQELSGMLRTYMNGSYYHSSDWESDSMSSFSNNHSGSIGRLPGIEEEDAPDNTGTLYELFDSCNEASDWVKRTDNQAIFTGSSPYDKWSEFNIFSNGRMVVNNAATDNSDSVVYSSGGSSICSDGGAACLDSEVGLSTMSLYNYLSTNFESDQMIIYSNNESSSLMTRAAHYSVNLIGSGIFGFLYWLSCFAVMGVVTILGLVYAIGMMVHAVKNSVKVLIAIPGSLLGIMKSIVQVIVTVVMLLVEVIGTIFCFNVMSQLLILLVTSLDNSWSSVGINSSTLIGGLLADIGFGNIQFLEDSKIVLGINLMFICVLLCVMIVGLLKKARCFHRVVNSVRIFVFSKVLDPAVVKNLESNQSFEVVFLNKFFSSTMDVK